jgi:hypothetical protein
MKMFGFDTLDWRQVKIDWDAITDDIIKAGTPMDKDGHICNDGNVFGILMDDVQRKRNVQGRVVISGCMDMKAAEEHSGITLSAEAKAALPDIWTQSGGASSWNDLTDKPFGETVVHGDTLTWDGNTDGRETFMGTYWKVSDTVPTLADCTNGVNMTTNGGQTATIPYEALQPAYDGAGFVGCDYFMFIPEDGFVLGDMTIPEAGVYLFLTGEGTDNEVYIASLTIPGYTSFERTEIKKLDAKYLPDDYMDKLTVKVNPVDDGTFNADKTYEEVLAAVEKGYDVAIKMAVDSHSFLKLPFTNKAGASLIFGAVCQDCSLITITYESDGTLTEKTN